MSPRLRMVILVGVIGMGVGCQSPEKQALEPLRANAPPLTYPELAERARRQVSAALEIFYRDDWEELAKAAETLRQTGQQLARYSPDQVPKRCRELWPKPAEEFQSAADQLLQHARQHDPVSAVNDFQRLHLALRQIRPD